MRITTATEIMDLVRAKQLEARAAGPLVTNGILTIGDLIDAGRDEVATFPDVGPNCLAAYDALFDGDVWALAEGPQSIYHDAIVLRDLSGAELKKSVADWLEAHGWHLLGQLRDCRVPITNGIPDELRTMLNKDMLDVGWEHVPAPAGMAYSKVKVPGGISADPPPGQPRVEISPELAGAHNRNDLLIEAARSAAGPGGEVHVQAARRMGKTAAMAAGQDLRMISVNELGLPKSVIDHLRDQSVRNLYELRAFWDSGMARRLTVNEGDLNQVSLALRRHAHLFTDVAASGPPEAQVDLAEVPPTPQAESSLPREDGLLDSKPGDPDYPWPCTTEIDGAVPERLVTLFYRLLRDHIPAGVIEQILMDARPYTDHGPTYSNPNVEHQARQWAAYIFEDWADETPVYPYPERNFWHVGPSTTYEDGPDLITHNDKVYAPRDRTTRELQDVRAALNAAHNESLDLRVEAQRLENEIRALKRAPVPLPVEGTPGNRLSEAQARLKLVAEEERYTADMAEVSRQRDITTTALEIVANFSQDERAVATAVDALVEAGCWDSRAVVTGNPDLKAAHGTVVVARFWVGPMNGESAPQNAQGIEDALRPLDKLNGVEQLMVRTMETE